MPFFLSFSFQENDSIDRAGGGQLRKGRTYVHQLGSAANGWRYVPLCRFDCSLAYAYSYLWFVFVQRLLRGDLLFWDGFGLCFIRTMTRRAARHRGVLIQSGKFFIATMHYSYAHILWEWRVATMACSR